MKNKIIYNSLSFLLVLLFSCSQEKSLKGTQKKLNFTKVDYFVCQEDTLSHIVNIPGITIPNEQVEVYAEMAGVVKQIHFEEGTYVKSGQPLVQIDTDILQAEREQLLVDLRLAHKNVERKRELFEKEAGTEEAYEQAVNQVEKLEAQIQLINVKIQKGLITAPFDGLVGLRLISKGAYITQTTRITTLAQVNPIKVEFSIDQKYAHYVQKGQRFSIATSTDSLSSSQLFGSVYAKEPMINEATKMLTVRGIIKDQYGVVPGSFVNVKFNLGSLANSVRIPTSAIVPAIDGQIIWKMKNNKAEQVRVTIGNRSNNYVQVVNGLSEKDTVILTGLLGMQSGKLVEPKNSIQ